MDQVLRASRFTALLLLWLLLCTAGVRASTATMESVGGMPAVTIDGQARAPLIFFGNTQFGTDEVAWEEIAKAANAGFHLHMIALTDYAQLDAVVAADPQARILLQTSVFPSWEWLAAHPDDEYRYADGTTEPDIPLASVTSKAWQQDYGEVLRERVRSILSHANGDRVVGLEVGYMTTGEWFYWGTNERKYSDYSPVNQAAFRTWLTRKYDTDAGLQAAWHEVTVTLAAAQIPTPAERDATHAFDFRDPGTSDQKMIDYYRFMADALIDAQEHFRDIVREETDGDWLIMHYWGYGYELSDTVYRANYGAEAAYARRSLGSPTLDAACGPYSYYWREPGQPGGSHSTQHSWALYNQLYWHEDDTRPTDLPVLIELARRNAARQLVYGGGLWWMDQMTEGWWNYQEFWDAMAPLRTAYEEYLAGGDRSLDPEFAIIEDLDVFAYLNDSTGLSGDAMAIQRLWFEAIGARTGYFTSEDLKQAAFPREHAKLYYFANPYAVSDDYLAWIDQHLKRNGNVLVWMYAPGLVTPNGLSDERMVEVTGISLHHSTTPIRLRTTITDNTSAATEGLAGTEFGSPDAHNPVVYADPGQEGVTTLGVYTDDPTKIAYCVKDLGTWKSVFIGGGGVVYVPVLRGLAKMAGVHIYPSVSQWPDYDDGMVVSKDFLALHAAGDGTRTLVFPEVEAEIQDAFTGEVLATNATALSLPVAFGHTYLLRLSPRLAAEVLSCDVPAEAQMGTAFQATIEFANRGQEAWSGAGGYALTSQPPESTTWGPSSTPLGSSETVPPGGSCAFTLSLTAPSTAGRYACRWRLSERGGRGGFGVAAQANVSVYTFSDVLPGHWAWEPVEACAAGGVVQGYGGGIYAPANPVTRDQMAVYVSRALVGGDAAVPTGPGEATFVDVPNTGYGEGGTDPYWAYKYVEYCVAQGVVQGYDATHYRPEVVVTRDQMAVFIARAKGWVHIGDDMASAPEVFSDVPAGFWCGAAIAACRDHGVVQGYGNGSYAPGSQVTRDQMAVYVARAFGLSL
jgi:hypothetical protein